MKTRYLIPLISFFIFNGCAKKGGAYRPPVPKVRLATLETMTVPEIIPGIGHVRAFNSAQICAQVTGYLVKISYTQGQLVQKGDLLITIDPRIYQAGLKTAQGNLLESKANKAFAQNKKERYASLIKDQFVSELDFFQYVCNDKEQDGFVLMKEGEVDKSQTNLDFCYIKAPFSGRCSKQIKDTGNLIANPGENLMTLNQITPIYIDFSVPEYEYSRIMRRQKEHNLEVRVNVPGSTGTAISKLIVVDNQIDQTTGQLPLRAQYENTEEMLWPGQFARCELVLQEIPDALMCPIAALGIGTKGKFVIKVDPSNHATYVWVETGVSKEGFIQLISPDLAPGDRIVIDGQINVEDGAIVQPI
ncbi:efflux RND transporter periplasmic adaptor subunit [bacterium]|nr:efflux RND transporter periplasmic adaptor subunit [bacterium]